MSVSFRQLDENRPPRSTSASMVIIGTALDTTWRAFVPTLGGTFLGIWLDDMLHTAPLAVLICMTSGTVLSVVLIIRQLKTVRKKI